MFRKLVALSTIAVSALLMSASTSAAKPTGVHDNDGLEGTFVIECDGYEVRIANWAEIKVTDYFHKFGSKSSTRPITAPQPPRFSFKVRGKVAKIPGCHVK